MLLHLKPLFIVLLHFYHINISQASEHKQQVIVGYVPEYRTGIDWNFYSQYVTDLILFSVEPLPDGDLKPYFPIDDEGPDSTLITAHRARNATIGSSHLPLDMQSTGIRLLLCVGGAGRSSNFPVVTSTKLKRLHFINNLIDTIKLRNLQGIDFDWEVPSNRKELQQYQLLIQEAVPLFHSHHLIVTATLHAWQDLGQETYVAIDRIHLMSYDGRGTTHSSYETAIMDIENLQKKGCPLSTIVLGVPFYGRGITNPNHVLTYNDLVEKVGADLDPTKDILGTGKNSIGFNNILTIQKKMKYCINKGLSGIFAWEIGQDSSTIETSLTKAISDVRLGIKRRKRYQKQDPTKDKRFKKAKENFDKKKKERKKKRKKKEELNEILIQSYNFKSYNIGYTKKLIRYVI